MSGLDFQQELARRHIGLPIIFLTGHGDIQMSVKAIKSGAVDFLPKPMRDQDLLDAVRVALARDRERRRNELSLSDLRARFDRLTTREQEVVASVIMGLMNKQVAGKMGVSVNTVKAHRHNAMLKLGVRSVPDLVRMAEMLGVRRRAPAS
jgi:FixJ family two-component response regulator